MSVSICDRMKIKVSPDKKSVVLQSISDDTSSSSYYGESSLYYMDLLYGKFQKISLATGPIHDFEWLPNGSNFITCAGHHPAKTNIYDNQAKFIKEICTSKVSTIRISPDSRILCLAGFGNLNGDIELFNLADYTIIGKTKLYCGVSLNWSKDSKFLIGAVLSPRVRVDNEYRVFSYHGEEVVCEKFNGEIYECDWVNNKCNFIIK
jgi:translation initiation factor 2A